eukprot:3363407-Rhodomonas_salina.2
MLDFAFGTEALAAVKGVVHTSSLSGTTSTSNAPVEVPEYPTYTAPEDLPPTFTTLDQTNGDHPIQTELAVPVSAPEVNVNVEKSTRPSFGHCLLAGHACVLASLQAVSKGDLKDFRKDAIANADAVTPLGAMLLRDFVLVEESGVPRGEMGRPVFFVV